MSYTLIQGTYRAVGFSPDGDSIRFAPNDVELVNNIDRANIVIDPGKSVQLRLECIDALETHFTSGSSRFQHQPMVAAQAGRSQLLTLLGFTGVQWDVSGMKVTGVDADDRPGYILTNTFDSYGTRPVSYAFAGDLPPNTGDGDTVFLTPDWLLQSANYKMVNTGFAYPMYYLGAYHDLRAVFNAAVVNAQAAASAASPNNVWTTDATLAGFADPPDAPLTQNNALWPKLFRRIGAFYDDQPNGPLSEFPQWLSNHRDNCFNLETGSWTALHNFVVWDGATNTIKMTKSPLNFLFDG